MAILKTMGLFSWPEVTAGAANQNSVSICEKELVANEIKMTDRNICRLLFIVIPCLFLITLTDIENNLYRCINVHRFDKHLGGISTAIVG